MLVSPGRCGLSVAPLSRRTCAKAPELKPESLDKTDVIGKEGPSRRAEFCSGSGRRVLTPTNLEPIAETCP